MAVHNKKRFLQVKGGVKEPTNCELYVVALHQAVPFVGFGIIDNSILILAGEAMDIELGAKLGISTMFAACNWQHHLGLVRGRHRHSIHHVH